MLDTRVILFHKQATSARTLFLQLGESVCAFSPLPTLAQLLDEDTKVDAPALHPTAVLDATAEQLGLSSADLALEEEFQAYVDTPDGNVPIFLARFTCMDPPREAMSEHAGRFIALTEARRLPQVELELLRRAYAVIMEG